MPRSIRCIYATTYTPSSVPNRQDRDRDTSRPGARHRKAPPSDCQGPRPFRLFSKWSHGANLPRVWSSTPSSVLGHDTWPYTITAPLTCLSSPRTACPAHRCAVPSALLMRRLRTRHRPTAGPAARGRMLRGSTAVSA
jgi:hypothetical protein